MSNNVETHGRVSKKKGNTHPNLIPKESKKEAPNIDSEGVKKKSPLSRGDD